MFRIKGIFDAELLELEVGLLEFEAPLFELVEPPVAALISPQFPEVRLYPVPHTIQLDALLVDNNQF